MEDGGEGWGLGWRVEALLSSTDAICFLFFMILEAGVVVLQMKELSLHQLRILE